MIMSRPYASFTQVRLLLNNTTASVVGSDGSKSWTIPSVCAKHCILLTDIRDQQKGEVEVELPLCGEHLEAWLTCARAPRNEDGATQDDATLLRALQARFLETIQSFCV